MVIKKNISENIVFLKNEDKVKIEYDYADNKNFHEYKSSIKEEKRNNIDEFYIKTNQGFIRKLSIEIIAKID